eukprot:1161795-Pelagomonas_calceolata.AAC.10
MKAFTRHTNPNVRRGPDRGMESRGDIEACQSCACTKLANHSDKVTGWHKTTQRDKLQWTLIAISNGMYTPMLLDSGELYSSSL